MERYQNGDLLGMIGRGTPGGLRRVDGSSIEPGVHLRWQLDPELGFPAGGFDVYRRNENNGHYWRCGSFIEVDVVGVAWYPHNTDHFRPGLTLTFTGRGHLVPGCTPGATDAASFPGDRVVRLNFGQPVRVVRIVFHPDTTSDPIAEAYCASPDGPVQVARRRARERGSERVVTLHADRIDYVVLRGADLVICEICFVLLDEGRGLFWPQIPLNGGTPIYLPITHPVWGSPHPHTPDDQAEAEARLPAALSAEKRRSYADGFADELHAILYDLVGTEPQRLHRLKNTDDSSAASLDWPGTTLLQMLALDPTLARVLGLYWHDTPPSPGDFYDYRVVAHFGDVPYPGTRVAFTDLEAGCRLGPILVHAGLSFVSPNPIETARIVWGGSEHTCLHIGRDIPAGPIAITLPEPTRDDGVRSVTLHLVAERAITVTAYNGNTSIATQVKTAGEVTLLFEEPAGIDRILLFPLGDVDLVSLILRKEIGLLGDLSYDVFHVRVNTPWPESQPSLEPPQVVATATGFDPLGELMAAQSRVDLRWERGEAGGSFLRSDAPVFYQIERADLAEDGVTVRSRSILNPHAPTLISERTQSDAGPAMYSDRGVPDGHYRYAVRGIDLFGVLGDWGPAQPVEVRDRQVPPPPQAVQAQYLDPADPYLSQEDIEWALANGPGVRLHWQWPGLFSLQAPDMSEPLGEFRAYFANGTPNRLDGAVTAVTVNGSTSTLTTDLDWPGAVDALAGLSLRVDQNFFVVTGHTSGADCTVTVSNLTMPDRAPTPGPCSLTIAPGHGAWRDFGRAVAWQRRLAVSPVDDAPTVSGRVVAVTDFDADAADVPVVVRPGATRTVTLDRGLQDPEGTLLPGILLCDGVVYTAYGHTLGTTLRLHLVPMSAPAASATLIEPAIDATCMYYPGRQYEIRVAGLSLPIADGQSGAVAHLALSSSDGQPDAADGPAWSRPGRGGLGGRAGNESALSTTVRIEAVRRTLPAGVANVPDAPDEPIFAAPANYYGQARYTLTWETAAGVAGYAVYRTSRAALFDQDRALRQGRKGAYTSGSVFADDPGFAAWLAGFDPGLTEAALLANVDRHQEAWRAWAERFYPSLTDSEVQTLAGLPGNEGAFRRVTPEAVLGGSHTDTFDGRGRGFYVYRVRTLDAAGNLSPWAAARAFPPVHIYDVTPPATPRVTGVLAAERSIHVSWRSNREPDLAEYRLWWSADPTQLADLRRTPPSVVVAPTGAVTETHVIEGLTGGTVLQVRVAAVDENGNVSEPSPTLGGRVIDTTPPGPPTWFAALWDSQRLTIGLRWQPADPTHEVLVQRSRAGGQVWTPVSSWLAPGVGTFVDATAQPAEAYSYRLQARSDSGLLSVQSQAQEVPAPTL